jgi:hypothetical protein
MKKAALFLVTLTVASSVYGQHELEFNNLSASGTITIDPTNNAGPSEGLPSYFPGTGYTASLYWGPASATRFDQLMLFPGADTVFFGAGIADPDQTNGAGLFDGGSITFPVGGPVEVAVAVWWHGPGPNGVATDYVSAGAMGYNVGASDPLLVDLPWGTGAFPPDLIGLASFTVGVVPEPGTLTLCGLGAAALLCLRRNIIL